MAKLKILEMNKNLLTYSQGVLDSASKMQAHSAAQLKAAKQFEVEFLNRLKEHEEAMAEKLQNAETEAKLAENTVEVKPEVTAEPAVKTVEEKPAPVKSEEKPEPPKAEEKPKAEPAPANDAPVQEKRKPAENPQKRKGDERPPQRDGRERQRNDKPGFDRDQRPKFDRDQKGRDDRDQRPRFDKDRDNNRQRGGYQKDEQTAPRNQERRKSSKQDKFDADFIPVVDTKEKQNNFEAKKNAKKKFEEAPKKRKPAFKEKGAVDIVENTRGARKNKNKKDKQEPVFIEPIKIDKITVTGDSISVKSFAEKTGKPVSEIIKKLLLLGMMCTINSEIDFDTAQLVASEFDIEVEQKIEQTAEDVLIATDEDDKEEDLVERSPIVTIMGHVDHGKTSLLDRIRESKVTETEAGGITQHIGAYTIEVNDKSITFLDTPGHEAFTAMRARGAQVTDIAILVVAADDGVMPQTIEAINHAKSANVPIIVAINKMDKDTADAEKIKQALTEYGLVSEEWGGDTIMVPVSAKTGYGISNLLEMILLVAEVQELKANPNRYAKGTIVEARLDKGRGPVATVLVQTGTLRVHDTIVAGTAYGRIRAMQDDMGKPIKEAGPSTPVEVIGFSEVPSAGDIMYAVEQDKLSKQVAEERREKLKVEKLKSMNKVSLDDLFSQIAEGQIKELKIIVKADVQGSVEAVKQSLEKLSNDEVRVHVIHGGVGAIKESDVLLASASNAIIIGFNVRPDSAVTAAAEREKVDVRLYRIIYNAIDDITKAMKGMLDPEYEEVVLGHCEIRQTFKVSSIGTIGGGYVQDGKITRNCKVRLLRDGIIVHEGSLGTLRRFKDDVKEVATGYECGLTIDGYNDIKEGDIIEAYEMAEIER